MVVLIIPGPVFSFACLKNSDFILFFSFFSQILFIYFQSQLFKK